jgi:hypothetical protein
MVKVEELRDDKLMFPIRGKNDELIVSRRLRFNPALGAVLGIELKKRLSPGALLQAQAEWLLYAPKSMFPYIQVSSQFLLLAYFVPIMSETGC